MPGNIEQENYQLAIKVEELISDNHATDETCRQANFNACNSEMDLPKSANRKELAAGYFVILQLL